MTTINFQNGEAIFGKGEFTYKKLLEDFKNSSFIGVVTFNISAKENDLLDMLKTEAKAGKTVVIVTNIPKRFSTYYHTPDERYKIAARKSIDTYLKRLSPLSYGANTSVYFNFSNHAKIIVTDNYAYWGSENFSDESKDNIECGTISSDPSMVQFVREELITHIVEQSVPYYKYNLVSAIILLSEAKQFCNEYHDKIHEASYILNCDYETDFNESFSFNYSNNGIKYHLLESLKEKFELFSDALAIIQEIIDDSEDDEIPVLLELGTIHEEYKTVLERTTLLIEDLCEDLSVMVNYNVKAEACRIFEQEFYAEAFDEETDKYLEIANKRATEHYEGLIAESEESINAIIECLKKMSGYFGDMIGSIKEYLRISPQIDNTWL